MRQIVGFVITVVSVAWIAYMAWQDHRAWERFKVEHDCRVIRSEAGRTHTVFHGDDMTTMHEGAYTCWRCNDGSEHCR